MSAARHLRLVPNLANDSVWEKELSKLLRRIEKVRAVMNRSADVKTVEVSAHWVKRHRVKKHERIIVTVRKKQR